MILNLDKMLQKHSQERPYQEAVGCITEKVTYQELNGRVNHIAAYLLEQNIQRGDRVAIVLENSIEFIVSYYACMRIGAISVPINVSFTAREFDVILKDCTPKIIITNPKVQQILTSLTLEFKRLFLLNEDSAFHTTQSTLLTDYIMKENEDCSILYTSGTTGTPKGAILSQGNLFSNALAFAEALSLSSEDRTLVLTPLSHIAAQSNSMNTMILCGGYVYLISRWESSTLTLETMEREEITFFFGPPTVYTYLLNDDKLMDYQLKLGIAYTGAAPLPENIFKKWHEVLGFEILEGYGLTECSPVVTVSPPQGVKKIGSVGLPLKGVQVKIVDEHFNEVQIGKPGELVVKGPNVIKGYYNRDIESTLAFTDGWFKTGDIAKKDSDGYIYIIDRQKDMIIRSGFNIYPREVEEVLYEHPAVLEAAVIGYPDEEKGELIKAIITLKKGIELRELKAFCKERLATYKVPQVFEVVETLPKTSSGKIIKSKLREIYS